MDVVVLGAGAVGLGLGSALLQAGARVRFVGRQATVDALGQHGLLRTGVFGRFACGPDQLEAAGAVAALTARPAEFVLVAVKSFDSETAAHELAGSAIVGAQTRIVSCQNGWGNAERLAQLLPEEKVWNARVITGFRRVAPNHVEITVHAEPIHVGSLFGRDPEEVRSLCDALTKGGLPSEPTAEIAEDLWAKLLYNALLNPLGALFDVPYGRLGESPWSRSILADLARETFAVMRAAGFRTHWATPEAYLDFFARELLPRTAAHESSTLQDLRAGKRTEIDALTGAVVELGEVHDVPVPVSRTLLSMIRFIEARRRSEAPAA